MERVALAFDHDRVSRVIAALITNDEIGVLGKKVGDLAFALVPPLGADESDPGH
jgi:hypothetical protein